MVGNLQVRACPRAVYSMHLRWMRFSFGFRMMHHCPMDVTCRWPFAQFQTSNFATIAKVAAGSTGGCTHPMKLSLSSLTRLDASESVNASVFGIYRFCWRLPLVRACCLGKAPFFPNSIPTHLFIPGGLTTMTVTEGACTVYQAPALTGVSSLVPVPIAQAWMPAPRSTVGAANPSKRESTAAILPVAMTGRASRTARIAKGTSGRVEGFRARRSRYQTVQRHAGAAAPDRVDQQGRD